MKHLDGARTDKFFSPHLVNSMEMHCVTGRGSELPARVTFFPGQVLGNLHWLTGLTW